MRTLFVAIVLVGCGGVAPGQPVGLVLDPCAQPFAASIDRGAHIWDVLGGEFSVGSTGVRVRCERLETSATGMTAGEWDGSSVVLADDLLALPTSNALIPGIVAHELGHAMGLVHESDPKALMYKNASGSLDESDVAQFCSVWHAPACN